MAMRLIILAAFTVTLVYGDSCTAVRKGCFKHGDNSDGQYKEHLLFSDRQEHKNEKFHSGKDIDWNGFEKYISEVACRCERSAFDKNYQYFSIRNFGECHGVKSIKGMESSEYCFYHDDNLCQTQHKNCVGAVEGEFVYEVNIKPDFTEQGGNCADLNGNCAYWARVGECCKNPVYMNVHCRTSCKICFLGDARPNCGYWGKIGECKRNPNYMLHHCKGSCHQKKLGKL